jgi:hypothetical protein
MSKVFLVLALTAVVMSAPALADSTKLPEFKKQPTPGRCLMNTLTRLTSATGTASWLSFRTTLSSCCLMGCGSRDAPRWATCLSGSAKITRMVASRERPSTREEFVPVGDTIGVSWRVEADWLAEP